MCPQLWWALPAIISVVALLWANFWPIKPGIHCGPKQVSMQLGAYFICWIVWMIGAIIK